mgnify:FL=1
MANATFIFFKNLANEEKDLGIRKNPCQIDKFSRVCAIKLPKYLTFIKLDRHAKIIVGKFYIIVACTFFIIYSCKCLSSFLRQKTKFANIASRNIPCCDINERLQPYLEQDL